MPFKEVIVTDDIVADKLIKDIGRRKVENVLPTTQKTQKKRKKYDWLPINYQNNYLLLYSTTKGII